MARQQRNKGTTQAERTRATATPATPAQPATLEDALNATSEHTLPVLSTDDMVDLPPKRPTRATLPSEPVVRAPNRAPTTSRRRTLGDATATLAAAERVDRAVRAEAAASAASLPTRVTGRPASTAAPPALSAANVPAVLPSNEDRRVAVGGGSESTALLIRGARKPSASYMPVVPRRSGQRSVVTQFVVAMVTVMSLMAVLTLASPLSTSAAFATTFQTYAGAVPWIPTPTPTPIPTPTLVPVYAGPATGVNPGQQVIINEINAVFGSFAPGALNIARCESGYDPNARNPFAVGDSHAEGVFQILFPSTWSGTSYVNASPYDYHANIRAAYEIFHRDGNSWREWECKSY